MPKQKRLLFCSNHSYIDHSSGAALATRDLLELMAENGWECAVLSGPEIDDRTLRLGEVLRKETLQYQVRPGPAHGIDCTLYHAVINKVLFHGFDPPGYDPRQRPIDGETAAFIRLFDTVLNRFQPEIVLTYGRIQITTQVIQRAKQAGARTVFALHNMDYESKDFCNEADAIIVPSQAARQHYFKALGLNCEVIAGPWNPKRFLCSKVHGRFVTFVNPQPYKGAFWVARMAFEIGRHRNDIPFLIVEARGKANWLANSGLDFENLKNLYRMPNTNDPRRFYRISRIVLVPSLCQDAHPRVAVEAITNGIPVLASRRGGLPEVLANAGILLDIPESYSTRSLDTPTTVEVSPWVEAIEDLWDNEILYNHERQRCLAAADSWNSRTVFNQFESLFRELLKR